MELLSPAEYGRVRPLYAAIDRLRAGVFAVLEHKLPAQVYADSRINPTSAAIFTDRFYLAGSPENAAFNGALADHIRCHILPHKENLMLFTFSEPWLRTVERLFAGQDVRRAVRTGFHFDEAVFQANQRGWRDRIPTDLNLCRLDALLAEQDGGAQPIWSSLERFLAFGFGYTMLHERRIVSTCQTVAVGGGCAEFGIHTAEAYRRRGLATLAGCACIEHCLAAHLLPEWQCYYNPPSEALAAALGFTGQYETDVVYIHTPPSQGA